MGLAKKMWSNGIRPRKDPRDNITPLQRSDDGSKVRISENTVSLKGPKESELMNTQTSHLRCRNGVTTSSRGNIQIRSSSNITPTSHNERGTTGIGTTKALRISGALTNGSRLLLLHQLGGRVNIFFEKKKKNKGDRASDQEFFYMIALIPEDKNHFERGV